MSETQQRFRRPAGVWTDPPAFNRLTAFARLAPSFLVLGAQRCGTTTLHGHLTAHPRVAAALRKEVHYFDFQFAKGRRWYLAHFPMARRSRRQGGVVAGEASPYYLVHPLAPERVQRFDPTMKLIAIIRDPAERAWSHYRHEVRRGVEPLDFEAALDAEPQRLAGADSQLRRGPHYYSYAHHHFSYLDRGRYAHYLEPWLAHFPRAQLLILKSEDLFRDANAVVNRAYDFLGLPPHPVPEPVSPVAASQRPALDKGLRKRLEAHFAPDQARLQQLLEDSN